MKGVVITDEVHERLSRYAFEKKIKIRELVETMVNYCFDNNLAVEKKLEIKENKPRPERK